eukprot:TRINITY_DN20658_c0_g2_i1.p1 TRINITY_DN20658_c0_g2~~TRINITY_DN20658_c0_g2_i1.p1  ORF type:complete len:540 (+),score=153.48 TRINITY_DN20658_c0_g2_i1:83-1702(+)
MVLFFFFFKQKTAYEMLRSLVGSEMCIRDSSVALVAVPSGCISESHQISGVQVTERLVVARHCFQFPGTLAGQLYEERARQLQQIEGTLRQVAAQLDLEAQLREPEAGIVGQLHWLEKRGDVRQLKERLKDVLDGWYQHLERLDSMAKIYPLLHFKYNGIAFRPSCAKSHEGLAGVPTNMQHYKVLYTAPDQPGSGSLNHLDSYDVLTVGAPAAHCFGYKVDEPAAALCSESKDMEDLVQIERDFASLRRADVCHCQAIGIAAACVQLAAEKCLDLKNWPLLRVQVQHGLLVHWNGMLSTVGDETSMISDMVEASDWMAHIRVLWRCGPSIEGIQVAFDPAQGTAATPLLQVSLPSDQLPVWIQSVIQESAPARVRVALFSVGVNEKATVARCCGQLELEREINDQGLEVMRGAVQCTGGLDGELSRLESVVAEGLTKDMRILTAGAELAQARGSVQLCSCKSAKDRTSMFVTLTAATLASSDPDTCRGLAEQLRVRGVRIQNCKMNTGVAQYAFNCFQRMHLPPELRPPRCVGGCRHS